MIRVSFFQLRSSFCFDSHSSMGSGQLAELFTNDSCMLPVTDVRTGQPFLITEKVSGLRPLGSMEILQRDQRQDSFPP